MDQEEREYLGSGVAATALRVQTSPGDSYVRLQMGYFGAVHQTFREIALDEQEAIALTRQLLRWLKATVEHKMEVISPIGQEVDDVG